MNEMEVFIYFIRGTFLISAFLSARMWWKSANVPRGTCYDLGTLGEEDPYIAYYNSLKWWEKQFFPFRYPSNQYFADGISADFNRYAALYACIAAISAGLDEILSWIN